MYWTIGLIGATIGAGLTGFLISAWWAADIARCQLAAQTAQRLLAERTAAIVTTAQRATDLATVTLAKEKARHDQHTQHLQNQIRQLRALPVPPEHSVLLNQAIRGPQPLPETPHDALDHSTTSPADSPEPTNLAEWAVLAANAYHTCRSQILALRTWVRDAFGDTALRESPDDPTPPEAEPQPSYDHTTEPMSQRAPSSP